MYKLKKKNQRYPKIIILNYNKNKINLCMKKHKTKRKNRKKKQKEKIDNVEDLDSEKQMLKKECTQRKDFKRKLYIYIFCCLFLVKMIAGQRFPTKYFEWFYNLFYLYYIYYIDFFFSL